MTAADLERHSVSVAAVTVDDRGRVLIIRRQDNGRWEPPGGVLTLDECIEDGLIREVGEEAGVRVRPDTLTGVYKNMELGVVALVYRCSVLGLAHTDWAETSAVRWMTREEVAAHLHPVYAERVTDALDAGSAPDSVGTRVRHHDGTSFLRSRRRGWDRLRRRRARRLDRQMPSDATTPGHHRASVPVLVMVTLLSFFVLAVL